MLKLIVKAYSQKIAPSLAEEQTKPHAASAMSRCIFHNVCWEDKSPLIMATLKQCGSLILLNSTIPDFVHRTHF